jgi:hypothetical protein
MARKDECKIEEIETIVKRIFASWIFASLGWSNFGCKIVRKTTTYWGWLPPSKSYDFVPIRQIWKNNSGLNISSANRNFFDLQTTPIHQRSDIQRWLSQPHHLGLSAPGPYFSPAFLKALRYLSVSD